MLDLHDETRQRLDELIARKRQRRKISRELVAEIPNAAPRLSLQGVAVPWRSCPRSAKKKAALKSASFGFTRAFTLPSISGSWNCSSAV